MSLTAKDIMTSNVVSIKEDTSIYEAIEILISENVNCLPVLNQKEALVGIITETDLIYIDKKLNETSHYAYSEVNIPIDTRVLRKDINRLSSLPVSNVMSTKVTVVKEDTPLENIIDIIVNRGIKTIPVIKDSNVMGIITRKNILKFYIK